MTLSTSSFCNFFARSSLAGLVLAISIVAVRNRTHPAKRRLSRR
jgi:hypothetical protein